MHACMQFYMEGNKDLKKFKEEADSFVCSNLPESPHHQVYVTPGLTPIPVPVPILLYICTFEVN